MSERNFKVRCTSCDYSQPISITEGGASLLQAHLAQEPCSSCREGRLVVELETPEPEIKISIAQKTLLLLESIMVDGDTYDVAIERLFLGYDAAPKTSYCGRHDAQFNAWQGCPSCNAMKG